MYMSTMHIGEAGFRGKNKDFQKETSIPLLVQGPS